MQRKNFRMHSNKAHYLKQILYTMHRCIKYNSLFIVQFTGSVSEQKSKIIRNYPYMPCLGNELLKYLTEKYFVMYSVKFLLLMPSL